MPHTMELHFDTDLRVLRLVRKFVAGVVRTCGGWEEDALAVETATGELLINAYEHAYARRSGRVDIDLRCDETKVELIVHSHGTPVTEPPVIPRTPPSGSRGRGLYLVGQLADEAEVLRGPNGRTGVAVRLAKYLRREG